MVRLDKCTACNGEGYHVCDYCKGSGRRLDEFRGTYETCRDCHGTGRIVCYQCHGQKYLYRED